MLNAANTSKRPGNTHQYYGNIAAPEFLLEFVPVRFRADFRLRDGPYVESAASLS
jgi:hypothetical protein